MHEDRRPGRGSQDARGTEHGSQHGVDEGRLPGAGRPADDDEERSSVRPEPGQEVVVDLREDLVPARPRLGDAGSLQRERRGGESAAHDVDGADEAPAGLGRGIRALLVALGHAPILHHTAQPTAGAPPTRARVGATAATMEE